MKKLVVNAALLVYAAVVVLPFLWVLVTSLKSGQQIFASPWSLPHHPQWINFTHAWSGAGIGKYFVNSLIVSVVTLVFLLPIGSMAAYVLARFPFKGSQVIFAAFIGGMMFPNFLVVVPLFFLLKNIHLLDSLSGLIVAYVAYSLSFTIFVMYGFFQRLPDELAEAAMMDGCGHSRAFWKIMLPLAKPGLIVVGIFNAIGLWNEYSLALVLISSNHNMTLPLGLANLANVQHYESDWGALFAALVIVMLPVLVVYWIFRDRIHEAMLAGAIK